MMFENEKEIFKTIIQLAKDRRLYYKENCNVTIQSGTDEYEQFKKYLRSEEYTTLKEKEQRLRSYLSKLDFETIKIVQTIMYLGRDEDYDKTDLSENIYEESREYMDKLGWNTKEIEINTMISKMPLDRYLENGLKILNIQL